MTVLLMLGALILFLLLENVLRRRTVAFPSEQVFSPAILPNGMALASNHMWAREEPDGSTKLGLDGFLARLLGKPDEVLLPSRKATIAHDTTPISFRMYDKTLRLQVPVAGKVIAVNRSVLHNPRLVAKDPYGKGWLLKVKRIPSLDRSENFVVADPGRWLREQIERSVSFFRARSATPHLATLQDGGVFTEGLLRDLGQETLNEFNRTFATLQKKD
jgi:glycine cleavage system H protein